MPRKCLGCGKDFEDKISICPDCFNAIENVRSQFDSLPKGLGKNSLLFWRRIDNPWIHIIIGIVGVIVLFMIAFGVMFHVKEESQQNIFFLIGSLCIFPILTYLFFLYLGSVWGRKDAVGLIKMLSDKEVYLTSAKLRKTVRYQIMGLLPVLVFWCVGGVMYYMVNTLNLLEPSSWFTMVILMGLALGFVTFIPAYWTGHPITYYKYTDWIEKLSR